MSSVSGLDTGVRSFSGLMLFEKFEKYENVNDG